MIKSEVERDLSAGLRRGLELEEVVQKLLAEGYSDFDINNAIRKIKPKQKKAIIKEQPKPEDIMEWSKEIEKAKL